MTTAKLTLAERYKMVLDWFETHDASPQTELHYRNPYELLVAVILSAQCTDKRVNMVTPALFKRFPDVHALSDSDEKEIFSYIKSISYPNAKSKHLLGMAKMLVDSFSGNVPSEVSQLIKLPGVGRKTANVIVSVVFDQPAMAVDTHVFRVSNRIGLTRASKNPLQTEKTLLKYIPREKVARAHHWIILHGRYVCMARKPACGACGIKQWCRYYSKSYSSEGA
jgi:endonuclease-3